MQRFDPRNVYAGMSKYSNLEFMKIQYRPTLSLHVSRSVVTKVPAKVSEESPRDSHRFEVDNHQ